MAIDDDIEALVREAIAGVVARGPARFEMALGAIGKSGDESATRELTTLTFVVGGSLIASCTGDRGTWEAYLDEIEDGLEQNGAVV